MLHGAALALRAYGVSDTWAQLAVLWETLQAMFQQHRDDSIQVRHLTRHGLERRKQDDKVFCFLPWCWEKGKNPGLGNTKKTFCCWTNRTTQIGQT